MKLSFSPCPNDTFIFHAMLHGLIDVEGLTFEVHIADVEELNMQAFAGKADITKLSYAACAYVADSYLVVDAGSALGRGNGPLLVARHKGAPSECERVAIPGKYTTAAFLMRSAFPMIHHYEERLFSEISQAVNEGEVDAGVLIHESRFTYKDLNLRLLADLGAIWEERTGLPIPLGCIAVSRDLSPDVQERFARVMQRSVKYALNNPLKSRTFVKQHSQELSDVVIDRHISMFVNANTVSLGTEGRTAVMFLMNEAVKKGLISSLPERIFL
ncbi:MAG: 1,4-dihydroxy-6-naphthoate synthase [Prevotellaceae bacterium]|jgi:1,4-dihydroxy-6-naphthoate synthase|nr:1,4-dihydroxy-6-naphthoate synthase [Prevotellaceae bacterium]